MPNFESTPTISPMEPSAAMTSQPPKPKSGGAKKAIFIVVVIVLLVVAMLAGSMMAASNYQKRIDAQEARCQADLTVLGDEISRVTSDLTGCNGEKVTLESQLKAVEEGEKAEQLIKYQGWKTYTQPENKFSFRYPGTWQAEEQLVEPGPTFEKGGYCLDFISPTDSRLKICYRDQDDDEATTWFRTGIGSYPSYVGANIIMGDTIITEKNIIAYNQKVKSVVYEPNRKDDGSGFGGRIAVDNYYFTIMADAMGGDFEALNISALDQVMMDKIIESYGVPVSTSEVE